MIIGVLEFELEAVEKMSRKNDTKMYSCRFFLPFFVRLLSEDLFGKEISIVEQRKCQFGKQTVLNRPFLNQKILDK